MSLQTRLETFATRVGAEIKTTKTSIAALPTAAVVDTKIATAIAPLTASIALKQDAAAIGNPETDLVALFNTALQ
jgi:hypothetical protein